MKLFPKPQESKDLSVCPARYTFIKNENGIAYCMNDTNEVYAYDTRTRKEIGCIQIDGIDGNWLEQINVDAAYQRRGIGTELIKLANEKFGFLVACVPEANEYEFFLTRPAEALIASCVRKDILKISQLRFAGSVPLNDLASGDPGYECLALCRYNQTLPGESSPRSP